MRAPLFIAFVLLGAVPAWAADEPSGCDKFKWNIDHERAVLTAPDRIKLASGAELAAPPERAPKEGTFAGFIGFKSAKAGIYTVSMPTGAWIDLVQDGHSLKPKAFSGATDCDGIRKTVKFDISASPFVLQLSGTKENSISVAILPSELP
jgi:hypothetical protein